MWCGRLVRKNKTGALSPPQQNQFLFFQQPRPPACGADRNSAVPYAGWKPALLYAGWKPALPYFPLKPGNGQLSLKKVLLMSYACFTAAESIKVFA
jgi:hypothetical protein